MFIPQQSASGAGWLTRPLSIAARPKTWPSGKWLGYLFSTGHVSKSPGTCQSLRPRADGFRFFCLTEFSAHTAIHDSWSPCIKRTIRILPDTDFIILDKFCFFFFFPSCYLVLLKYFQASCAQIVLQAFSFDLKLTNNAPMAYPRCEYKMRHSLSISTPKLCHPATSGLLYPEALHYIRLSNNNHFNRSPWLSFSLCI